MKLLLVLASLMFSGVIWAEHQADKNIPEYNVPLLKHSLIKLDGQRNETAWGKALRITEFINPWHKNVNPATSVELFYDGNDLYFFFEAIDPEIVVVDSFTNERNVASEDRVELFFSKDITLSSYFGFEMDPKGRILDYQCSYYRKFNHDWSAGKGLEIKAEITLDGYTVEGRISKELLEFMTGGKGSFYWGAYRAEYSRGKDGDLIDRWQCLRDPKTKSPDFHLPDSFCRMILGSN